MSDKGKYPIWIDILGFTIFIVICAIIMFFPEKESIYYCISIDNEGFYTNNCYTDYGELFGIKEDGTIVKIKSYKKVENQK